MILPSLLHAWSHSASPFQKICYPFSRCMQVQKVPDELSAPCCEIREKNLSPGNQNLSSSPLGLQLSDVNQTLAMRSWLLFPDWLILLLGVDHHLMEKGEIPNPNPVLNSPSSSSLCTEKGWTTTSPGEMVAAMHTQENTTGSTWNQWDQAQIQLWKCMWHSQVRFEVWEGDCLTGKGWNFHCILNKWVRKGLK